MSSSASLRHTARPLARAVLVLLAVSAATHFLLDALPGDAVDARLGVLGSSKDRAELRAAAGLDGSALTRYAEWLRGAAHGDLGASARTGISVTASIADRLPITFELVVCSQALAIAAALALALAAARYPRGWLDRVSPITSIAALSIPTYLAAVLLISIFSVRLGWFPTTDYTALGAGMLQHLRSIVLPAVALAVPEIAVYQRSLRSRLASVVTKSYVAAATGRGLSPRRVLLRHALPNAAVGTLALIAPAFGRTLGATVVVEQIFSVPGLGRYAVDAINARDQPAIVGTVVVVAAVYLLAAAGTGLLLRRLDPRIAA